MRGAGGSEQNKKSCEKEIKIIWFWWVDFSEMMIDGAVLSCFGYW